MSKGSKHNLDDAQSNLLPGERKYSKPNPVQEDLKICTEEAHYVCNCDIIENRVHIRK